MVSENRVWLATAVLLVLAALAVIGLVAIEPGAPLVTLRPAIVCPSSWPVGQPPLGGCPAGPTSAAP